MIRDKAGNMYGTTAVGGAEGYGTVFKLSADETETVLYPFCSLPNCADGMFADAALVTDNAGNFYSTTAQGGDKNRGTVFKLAPDGTETVLHSFSGDGSYPRAGC